MTEHVIWCVVWLVLALFTSYPVGAVVGVAILLLAEQVDNGVLTVLGFVIGWLAGVSWFIFCAVHSLTSFISAINSG